MKTIANLIEDYLSSARLNGAAASWIEVHRFYLRNFARWQECNTKAIYPADLRPECISAWQRALQSKPNDFTGLPLKPITHWTYT